MSQDLFAAFGEAGVEDTGSIWSKETKSRQETVKTDDDFQDTWATDDTAAWGQDASQPKDSFANDDDDDFGDFEDASAPSGPAVESQPEMPAVDSKKLSSPKSPVKTSKPFPPKAPPKPKSAPKSPAPRQQESKVGHHPFAGRMDLLFEADDDEYDAGEDELGDLSTNPEAAVAYSKRIIAAQEAARAKSEKLSQPSHPHSSTTSIAKSVAQQEPSHSRQKSNDSPAKDPNVLFDADNISEHSDDDFDDFEIAEDSVPHEDFVKKPTVKQSQSALPAMDLLGLDGDIPEPTTNDRVATNPSSGQEERPSMDRQLNERSATSSMPPQLDDDAWDDFETAAPFKDVQNPSSNPSSPPISNTQFDRPKSSPAKPDALPPTNVPPPAMILSLFPTVFAEADEALFDTIGKLDLKQKQMLLAHPASHQFLKSYLGHCTVLARIIAGRKLRWKRDQRLSQSMRIGPAAAGGKSGMKLAGVDRSEVAKEDREVLDVLRVWKGQVGKLRTAVAAASSAPGVPRLPSVPEIAEQMPVKTLKAVEGGFTAPQPCAFCGLKREERVGKVDVEVEDSFGEWWVETMNMHVSCRDFWDEFEKKLKSR